jgi:hypothetical protein
VSFYQTAHFGLSSLLSYNLGPNSLRAAFTNGDKGPVTFTFEDSPPGRCQEIADLFFADTGATVENARELLECTGYLRRVVASCRRNSGEWTRVEDVSQHEHS